MRSGGSFEACTAALAVRAGSGGSGSGNTEGTIAGGSEACTAALLYVRAGCGGGGGGKACTAARPLHDGRVPAGVREPECPCQYRQCA